MTIALNNTEKGLEASPHSHTALCGCQARAKQGKGLVANARQPDPTRTTLIRKRWSADMTRRFKQLKRDIWKAIVIDDVFGLKESKPVTVEDLIGGAPVVNVVQGELFPRQFQFSTSEEKVTGFMSWLRERVNSDILEVTEMDGPSVVAHSGWQNIYIDSAYKKGLTRGEAELAKAGITVPPTPDLASRAIDATFLQPIHADRVGLLYTRSFNELKGITDALDQTISRSLAEGIAEGRGPRQMARILLNRIEKTGGDLTSTDSLGRTMRALPRARTLARTETIRAHHAATINTYRSAGVEGVVVKAEWSTAGDDRVCEECEGLEGRVYTLDQIEGMIPRHPNCRCVALPAEVTTVEQGDAFEEAAEEAREENVESFADTTTQGGRGFSFNPLNENQLAGVKEYTSGAYNSEIGGYGTINPFLRTGSVPKHILKQGITTPQVKSYIGYVDDAIQNSVASEDITLLRGIRNTAETFGIKDKAALKVGLQYTDDAYTSTTTSTKIVKRFSEKLNFSDDPRVLRIEVPKGHPAMPTKLAKTVKDSLGQEAEVLLPRGMKFEITKISGKNIYLKIIPKDTAITPSPLPKIERAYRKAVKAQAVKPEVFDDRVAALLQHPKFEGAQELLKSMQAVATKGTVEYTDMYASWVKRVPDRLVKRYKGDAKAMTKMIKANKAAVKATHGKGPVTLYRGTTSGQGLSKGMSFWTSDQKFASAFAGPGGKVHKIEAAVDQIMYSSRSNPTAAKFYLGAVEDGRGFPAAADEYLVWFKKAPKTEVIGKGTAKPEWMTPETLTANEDIPSLTEEDTVEGLILRFTNPVSQLVEEIS